MVFFDVNNASFDFSFTSLSFSRVNILNNLFHTKSNNVLMQLMGDRCMSVFLYNLGEMGGVSQSFSQACPGESTKLNKI